MNKIVLLVAMTAWAAYAAPSGAVSGHHNKHLKFVTSMEPTITQKLTNLKIQINKAIPKGFRRSKVMKNHHKQMKKTIKLLGKMKSSKILQNLLPNFIAFAQMSEEELKDDGKEGNEGKSGIRAPRTKEGLKVVERRLKDEDKEKEKFPKCPAMREIERRVKSKEEKKLNKKKK
jgi:hypothetical protein